MSQSIENFLCSNCQGDQYYEDNQGHIICNYCGIQSQDYIPESHEANEEGMVFSQSVRRHTHLSGKAKFKKQEYEPELLDYLTVFQYCLQMLGNCSFQVILVQESSKLQALQATLKALWIGYLEEWNRADSACKMSLAFKADHSSLKYSSTFCYCQTEKLSHPLFPTKPLLLGFLYLTIRIHRLDVIIADIIRWIERGLLPFLNLWDCLPDTIKVHLNPQYRKVFNQQTSLSTGIISPMNIWFHTCSLGESLGIEIPTLNGPLIGYSFIHSLGLPPIVKVHFAQFTQLFTTAIPLSGANVSSEHYVEYIMAVVIICCMMSKDWMHWEYLSHTNYLLAPDSAYIQWQKEHQDQGSNPSNTYNLSDSNSLSCIPAISHLHELNSSLFRRSFLSTYALQLSRLFPKEIKPLYSLKNIFEETFQGFTIEEKQSLQWIQSFQQEFHYSDHYLLSQPSFEDNLSPSSTDSQTKRNKKKKKKEKNEELEIEKDLDYYYHLMNILNPSQSLSDPSITTKSQQRLKRKRTIPPLEKSVEKVPSNVVRYATPALYEEQDLTGIPAIQYTILVERCAKYLYITPTLLHAIIQSIDTQIIELTLLHRVSKLSTTSMPPTSSDHLTNFLLPTKNRESRKDLAEVEIESEKSDNSSDSIDSSEESDTEEGASINTPKVMDVLEARDRYFRELPQHHLIRKQFLKHTQREKEKRIQEYMESEKISFETKEQLLRMKEYSEESQFNFPLIYRLLLAQETFDSKDRIGAKGSQWRYDDAEDWWNEKSQDRSDGTALGEEETETGVLPMDLEDTDSSDIDDDNNDDSDSDDASTVAEEDILAQSSTSSSNDNSSANRHEQEPRNNTTSQQFLTPRTLRVPIRLKSTK